jgi:hypothetical protein
MKTRLIILAQFVLQSHAHAGGAPYRWCDFGSGNGKFYGIGEISNQITFFLGDAFWISPIPGFVTYWKDYTVLTVILIACLIWWHKRKQRKMPNKAVLPIAASAAQADR